MLKSLIYRSNSSRDILASELFDQNTFYKAFNHDLRNCKREVIIESPFITTKRISSLLPVLTKLTKRGVRIVINTRNPEDHDGIYRIQAEQAIVSLQNIGVLVLYTGGHHRKIAIIDKSMIWEGSLNILSHNDSCEIMRRTESKYAARQLIKFVKLDKYL